jgi:Ser/Thr protein kinase RdoA (MazF antagonist)
LPISRPRQHEPAAQAREIDINQRPKLAYRRSAQPRYDYGMPDRDVQSVLSFYGVIVGTVRTIEPLGNAGGWSGSRLWRLTNSAGDRFCLRRWPAEHPTAERLRLIHAVLTCVAPQLPAVAVPLNTNGGLTFIEHSGHLWELTAWRPGTADYHAHPSRPRLRAAMHALARFHVLAARFEQHRGRAQTLVDRHRLWSEMRDGGLSLIEQALATPLDSEIDSRALCLLPLARNLMATSPVAPALAAAPELPLQPAIRDIHHDHVLFTGDEVTGIIDFGALRIDTPLADIARLAGSLAGDDREARQFAFASYSEIRPLSDTDRRLIELLDETGLVLGAVNWLTWLYVERRDMGPPAPIARRLDEIIKRLVGQTFRCA